MTDIARLSCPAGGDSSIGAEALADCLDPFDAQMNAG
jgi:hypothetical protein